MFDRNTTNMQNLEQVIENLRKMGDLRGAGQNDLSARLRSSIGLLRQIELDLGRDLSSLARKDGFYSAEESEVPQKYRRLVDEYFRNLARSRPSGQDERK
jgi:hypothetical protein